MAIAAASADGKDVFGKNGLFDELKKALAERMRMAPRLRPSGGFGHLSKNDFMLPAPPPRIGPMKLAAVMIVAGCRCDLVWHCGRKGNGDGKANQVMTNGATITAVKSCSILSTPKRGGCNPV
jgi:hypothetical protein